MLTQLHIHNFGIVDELALEFNHALTVITGETGAGKSIIFDALDYALGARADNQIIRSGETRCDITATFDIAKHQLVKAWLDENELNAGDECVLRRTVNRDGRSRSYINGIACPLQVTKHVGNLLVAIHGQHQHQSLTKREIQRELLDSYAQNSLLLQACEKYHDEWQNNQKLQRELSKTQDAKAELELLEYQITELDGLAVSPGEYERLIQEHKLLVNADALQTTTQSIVDSLRDTDDLALISELDKHLKLISNAKNHDATLKNVEELLQQARVYLSEACDELSHYGDSIDNDPETLKTVEARLDGIHDLARKHHVKPELLHEHHQGLINNRDKLVNAGDKLSELNAQAECIQTAYNKTAKQLHAARVKAATQLGTEIAQQVKPLGMPQARFEISVTQSDNAAPCVHGQDSVEFLFTANPGHAIRPLHKVASGGELSRIALAIQVLTQTHHNVPTLLFDEVDVGIGGTQAAIVGQLLQQLSKSSQILCVTHQPQVAACANIHLQVQKTADKDTTQSRIIELNKDDKIAELARMLGGKNITKQTIAHAKDMLAQMA